MDSYLLSEAGQRRRDQILLLAKAEAKHRRKKRLLTRAASLCIVFITTALIVTKLFHPRQTPVAPERIQVAAVPLPVPENSVTIDSIQTDPTLVDRLTLPPAVPRWTHISDNDLIQQLTAAGQPTAIAFINGKTILLPQTDGNLR